MFLSLFRSRRPRFPWLLVFICALPMGLLGAAPTSPLTLFGSGWEPFAFLTSSAMAWARSSACSRASSSRSAGLGYAVWLMKQVYAADTGTPAMQEVAQAVREGANAYLRRQFTVVGVLIVVLTVVIIASKWPWQRGTRDALRPTNCRRLRSAAGSRS